MTDLLNSNQNLFLETSVNYRIRLDGQWYRHWIPDASNFVDDLWYRDKGPNKSTVDVWENELVPLPEEWLVRLVADKLAGKVLE